MSSLPVFAQAGFFVPLALKVVCRHGRLPAVNEKYR